MHGSKSSHSADVVHSPDTPPSEVTQPLVSSKHPVLGSADGFPGAQRDTMHGLNGVGHWVSSGWCWQNVPPLTHESIVHERKSSQSPGPLQIGPPASPQVLLPAVHAPALQKSGAVHPSPSSQPAPSVSREHGCVWVVPIGMQLPPAHRCVIWVRVSVPVSSHVDENPPHTQLVYVVMPHVIPAVGRKQVRAVVVSLPTHSPETHAKLVTTSFADPDSAQVVA